MNYAIHERNLEQLKSQVAKLARRAEKLKLPPITLAVGQWTNITNPDNANEVTRVYDVEVIGDAPRLNGWSFIASILHDESGNVVRKARGATDLPFDPLTQPSTCEHCRVNRFRSCTFLVRHEDGRFVQVGSTCLRDFIGHNSPHDLATWAEQVLNLNELCEAAQHIRWLGGQDGSRGRYLRMSLPVYLGHVAEQALTYGFKGKKDVRDKEKTTAAAAFDAMFPAKTEQGQPVPAPVVPRKEAVALAETAMAWVLRRFRDEGDMAQTHDYDEFKLEMFHSPDAGMSEFQSNLFTVARHEIITASGTGIAAWIVGAYIRHQEKLARFAEEAKTSKHFGTVGERLRDLALTYYDFKEWETSFGWQTLYKFKDAAGNQFTWKTNSAPCLEMGKTYKVTATVKEHNDFNGVAQTKLTRCKPTLMTEAA